MHTPQIKQYVCASKSRGGEKLSGNTGEDYTPQLYHVTINEQLSKNYEVNIRP